MDFGQVRTDPDLDFLRADSRFEVRTGWKVCTLCSADLLSDSHCMQMFLIGKKLADVQSTGRALDRS